MAPPDPRSCKMSRLVLAAIGDLGSASTEAIADHIKNEFRVGNEEVSRYMNNAIKRGVAFGVIRKQGDRYDLDDIMEKVRSHRRRRRRSRRGRRRRRRRRRRRY